MLLQAAFLSSLVGVDAAEVAARAAVTAFSDIAEGKHQENLKASSENAKQKVINHNLVIPIRSCAHAPTVVKIQLLLVD